jgi:hypothetical protein
MDISRRRTWPAARASEVSQSSMSSMQLSTDWRRLFSAIEFSVALSPEVPPRLASWAPTISCTSVRSVPVS